MDGRMMSAYVATDRAQRLTPPSIHAICGRGGQGCGTMTGTTRSSEGLDAHRRKLLFRSWHRGMREMDLILGTFADAEIGVLTDDEIDQYERLLDTPDPEFLPIVTGERPVPVDIDCPVLRKIIAFRHSMTF
jgi:antitoxin CptB